jgi:hypothetical protein
MALKIAISPATISSMGNYSTHTHSPHTDTSAGVSA